jgi:hypothetical protein
MPVLGLGSSATSESYWSEKARRAVLHQYPQGKAPLMYLLSLMEDEETDKPKFGWWEERDKCVRTTTATSGSIGGGGAGPFTTAAYAASQTGATFSLLAGAVCGLYLTDASQFVVNDLIWIRQTPNAALNGFLDIRGRVTAVDTANNRLLFTTLEAVTAASNAGAANGIFVYMYGSSAPEGDRSRAGSVSFPLEIENYTQIFRHSVGPFSRTALKAGVRFDSTGIYKETAHRVALRHMKSQELTALRGVRANQTVTNSDGDTVPEYKTGGIEWFLRQWELGNTTNSGAFNYRPGETSVVASDWRTADDKRIINANGAITVDEFEMLIERAFRFTNDTTFEKLCLCGNGFLSMFNKLVKQCSYKITELESKETFGMNMTRWVSPWGTLLFKTHPLLNEVDTFRNDAYILDTGNLKYRPLTDSDTELLTNRQNNDSDGRKDEWLTEAGIEVHFPESHMFIQNVTNVTE